MDRLPTDPLFQPGTKPQDATVVIFLTGGKSPSTKKDDENAIRKLTDQGYRVVLIAVGDDVTLMGNKDGSDNGIGPSDSRRPTTMVVTSPHPDRESDIDDMVKNIMKGIIHWF